VEATPAADAAAQQEVVEAFLAAARGGEFVALVAVLDPGIVIREDTGSGTLFEVRGAEEVARRAASFARLGLDTRPALVNGAAGWVARLAGELYAIAALTVRDGRVTAMDILRDPGRLAGLDVTIFDAPT
jgi:RNA polymerase sigma-70 factor (ECF subfamily)